jgi:DNA replication protein DnaC
MDMIDLGQERAKRRADEDDALVIREGGWEAPEEMPAPRPMKHVVLSDAKVSEPYVPPMDICPTCKHPLSDTHFGNLIDYWPPRGTHQHTERCASGREFRKYGYCLIPCPTCSGGVTAKRAARLINELFGDAHIPFYGKDWRFSSFPGDEVAKEAVRGFMRKSLDGARQQRGLYLTGNVGTGKTSLAISALQFVLRKGRAGVFVSTVELFDILKESIAANKRLQAGDTDAVTRFEASKGARLLRLLREVEWAVLDDLGVEAGSRYEIKELYLILEARRSNGLYTIFTSNLDRDGLSAKWGVETDDARRVIDRLGEYCMTIPVKGQSMRLATR